MQSWNGSLPKTTSSYAEFSERAAEPRPAPMSSRNDYSYPPPPSSVAGGDAGSLLNLAPAPVKRSNSRAESSADAAAWGGSTVPHRTLSSTYSNTLLGGPSRTASVPYTTQKNDLLQSKLSPSVSNYVGDYANRLGDVTKRQHRRRDEERRAAEREANRLLVDRVMGSGGARREPTIPESEVAPPRRSYSSHVADELYVERTRSHAQRRPGLDPKYATGSHHEERLARLLGDPTGESVPAGGMSVRQEQAPPATPRSDADGQERAQPVSLSRTLSPFTRTLSLNPTKHTAADRREYIAPGTYASPGRHATGGGSSSGGSGSVAGAEYLTYLKHEQRRRRGEEFEPQEETREIFRPPMAPVLLRSASGAGRGVPTTADAAPRDSSFLDAMDKVWDPSAAPQSAEPLPREAAARAEEEEEEEDAVQAALLRRQEDGSHSTRNEDTARRHAAAAARNREADREARTTRHSKRESPDGTPLMVTPPALPCAAPATSRSREPRTGEAHEQGGS